MGRKSLTGQKDLLSKREVVILAEITSGKTYDEIGASLGLSGMTVKSHADAIRKKMGVRSILHAVAIAFALNIISDSVVTAGNIPLDVLRGEHKRPQTAALQRITLDSSVSFLLAETQLVNVSPQPDRRVWWRLSGWLAQECPPLRSIRRGVLSHVSLPSRPCPTGQEVLVRTTKNANEYGLGVFVELTWPKYGSL